MMVLLATTLLALVQQDGPTAERPSEGAEQPQASGSAAVPTRPPNDTDGLPDVVVTGRRRSVGDPLERVNVKSFEATQSVDRAVVGPAAAFYVRTVPVPVQTGVSNALSNLHEPVVFANYLLQLKPGKAAETFGRFAINTTFGLGGFVDVAKRRPFRLPRRPNGFGDTLGYYGVGPGPFLFVPIVGATTVRDLIGTALDRALLPFAVGRPFNRLAYSVPVGLATTLDRRAGLDEKLEQLNAEPDPYAARRRYYLETRRSEIENLHGASDNASASSPHQLRSEGGAKNLSAGSLPRKRPDLITPPGL